MSSPLTNPFSQADFSKLMDSSKIMPGFKMPGFDMNALIEMQRKNIEMVTAINQATFESLRAFAHRQVELVKQGCEEAANLMNDVICASTPQEKALHHAEASKAVVEKCMANARDAAETLTKCSRHVMETMSNRMTDGVKELQGLVKADTAV